jgi:hypothetical protein
MTRNNSALTLALTTAFALSLGAAPASSKDDVYKKMANDFAKYSTDKKVKNVSVIGFSRKARTSREESEYFSEKLMSCLVASGKMNLLERGQLDKVLEERRLAASGVTEEQDGSQAKINPSDAIIVGTIFGTKDQLRIIAKMIDPLTGAVLHTVEGQTDRQWDIQPDRPEFSFDVPDLKEIAAMFGEEDLRPAFVDFRDAPVSLNTESCNARRARLSVMQGSAIDVKARYWAQQMRSPVFASSKLTRNPGGEIVDQGERKKFYLLLEGYNKKPEAAQVSLGEMNTVISLMNEEAKISDECGLH